MNTFKINWKEVTAKAKAKEEKKNNKESKKDVRFYYPQFKEDGTAEALIRLLPYKLVNNEPIFDQLYVQERVHSFKVNNQWLIENCLWTDGYNQKCPICGEVSLLYKDTATKKIAGDRKAKTKFIANILVVNDPANPENNGKVFLFKFGVKIKEKIIQKWMPKEDSIDADDAVPIWDLELGANFALKITKSGKDEKGNTQIDYSTSDWKLPRPIPASEHERIYTEMYDLREFINPSKFKTPEELKARYDKVCGVSGVENIPQERSESKTGTPTQKSTSSKASITTVVVEDDDEKIDDFDTFMGKMKKTSDSSKDDDSIIVDEEDDE